MFVAAAQYSVTPTKRTPLPERASVFFRDVKRRSLRAKRVKHGSQKIRKSDSFVNSQEWTLSRGVPDLRLGIVGSLSSGKSALVHRYLTGSYMQEESPEGGRFKKEIVVDGQSYLLLIRDEGGPPETQFTSWVDAVIFVFSLENEASFNAIYNYYTKMSHLRNMAEIPLILVGTQDAISETQPRVIDDSRARKLAADLKKCSYYETCATYGLNVERVFQDACQKITSLRRPSTPSHNGVRPFVGYISSPTGSNGFHAMTPQALASPIQAAVSPANVSIANYKDSRISGSNFERTPIIPPSPVPVSSGSGSGSEGKFVVPSDRNCVSSAQHNNESNKENTLALSGGGGGGVTPTSTPTSARKNRRRSNLFTPSKKTGSSVSAQSSSVNVAEQAQLGSGRSIPIRQGVLYKKSNKSFSKDWKKKYVALCDDGRMTYHPSLHDYMENINGKEISLQYVTVKVPGQKPRGSRSVNDSITTSASTSANFLRTEKKGEKVLLTGYELLKEPSGGEEGTEQITDTPNVKKRHRRIKSNGIKANQDCEDADAFEFHIVSLDNKQWFFEAASAEERDEWVGAIEQQILNSLQGNEISKGQKSTSAVDQQTMKTIKNDIPGNLKCVDCDAPNPDWASLNLGVLICIECSGIHRQLGSHISRVRSLDLDEWPPGHLSVMVALGNRLANTVWEANQGQKPTPQSSPEERERYIIAKYSRKEFLSKWPSGASFSSSLVDAVCRQDMKTILLVLAHATTEDINAGISARDARTPLHLAASYGNLAVCQMLIWANANVKCLDHEGRTCIYYARTSGCQELVDLLLSNGCPDVSLSGTLPRRKNSITRKAEMFDKIASSVL